MMKTPIPIHSAQPPKAISPVCVVHRISIYFGLVNQTMPLTKNGKLPMI